MATERKQTDEVVRGLPDTGVDFWKRVSSNIKAGGRELLPQSVLREVRRYRGYTGIERSLYLKIRLLNSLGLANRKRAFSKKRAGSFLFVCFGNIMRSPICEALMNRALTAIPDNQITVTSAGLNAIPGRRAHPWAIAAARDLGIDLENHRARRLTDEIVDQADVIFAMDYQNQVQLFSRYARARNKIFMLGAYVGEDFHCLEIRDPYYGNAAGTRDCYKILATCIQNVVRSFSDER
jgi:protein-tyrosine phosphatase